jgi:hypothetical protein
VAKAGAIGLETNALSRKEATINWSAWAGLGYGAQLAWISLALLGLPAVVAGGPLRGCR